MLEVKHICVRSPKKRVLEDISFTLQEKGSLAIVGESGSGKTTLLKLILGLSLGDLQLERGEITWYEQERLSSQPEFSPSYLGGDVAWVSQQAGRFFYDRRTIQQHYRDVVKALKGKTPQIRSLKECLDLVGLDVKELKECYPFELSGGMMQRLAIGLSLVGYPRLLLADEPTSALDVLTKKEIVTLLLNLKEQEGLALLLVTHDISVALKLAEQTLVLRLGKTIECGLTRDVLRHPQTDYTKRLVACVPRLMQGYDHDHHS